VYRGIGNLLGMPIAYALGRRIVFLFSTAIIIVGSILSAKAETYEWHLEARMLLGIAAGQSEALVPMITQVGHRSRLNSKKLLF
jgi:predicted MFS family arabinose efflux permease